MISQIIPPYHAVLTIEQEVQERTKNLRNLAIAKVFMLHLDGFLADAVVGKGDRVGHRNISRSD